MKKQSVQFFFFYFLYNAALVIYNNYIPLYYRTVCGFSQTQIGTVVSAGPLATVFGMFFFGRLADRMKNRNLLAGILLFLSGALTALVCIRKHVPDSLQASGQTLIGLVNYGAAKFTANFFGGRLNHAIGYEGCMLICGISAGIAALLVCALARRYRLFEEKANTEAS